jgi:phage tail sheath protein FI
MTAYLAPGVYVESVEPTARPIAGVGTSTAGFIGVVPNDVTMPLKPGSNTDRYPVADAGEPNLITGWEQFKTTFGDFQESNKTLAHAVYGFFNNGGTRCWVIRVAAVGDITDPADTLSSFAPIDEIAIIAVPGATTSAQHEAILNHCSNRNLQDRVAILDGVQLEASAALTAANIAPVGRSEVGSYGAIYYPWIKVFDPVTNNTIAVPPSGHMAGIYARNDSNRGVYKAPANEEIRGVVGVDRLLSKADQEGLNPEGINVIRVFSGTVKVWGGRTRADETHAEFRYISTRRYFNFLRESIDQGTQFAVFEPHTPALWQRIKRSVSDFLLNQWREGALFGEIPQQAFFVKCDAETNPPEVRQLGRVITEIGVAIVQPAEFVIFRIQQTTGG